jgi:dGTPase
VQAPESRFDRRHDRKPNPVGDDRASAQRDRDRILYSSSFRRLAEVTQVVSADSGYVFHNRLTHSLQVAQVGRRLAEKLTKKYPDSKAFIDPDVVEAACMAHDLGHPPFGHAAEITLNSLTESFGGFEGNAQSFRIITRLASRSPEYPGLDLTCATLAATLKYPWIRGGNPKKRKKWGAYSNERNDFEFASKLLPSPNHPTIEAQLMDWADDITYSVHDLEDFFRAGRIPLHLLGRADSTEQRDFFKNVFERHIDDSEFQEGDKIKNVFTQLLTLFPLTAAYNGSAKHRSVLRYFTGFLIGRYINAARIEFTGTNPQLIIDEALRVEVNMLKELTWTYVIEGASLAAQQHGQKKIISELYKIYSESAVDKKNRAIFPMYYREKLAIHEGDPTESQRIPVDLIASMTESQAVAMYHRLTGTRNDAALFDILS